METVAVRLYGANDLRLERFELPEMAEDEVLLRVMTDSLCASSYKMILQGSAHKRVPPNVAEQPIIIGHELCGEIVEVGAALRDSWRVGQRVVIQPALKLESGYAQLQRSVGRSPKHHFRAMVDQRSDIVVQCAIKGRWRYLFRCPGPQLIHVTKNRKIPLDTRSIFIICPKLDRDASRLPHLSIHFHHLPHLVFSGLPACRQEYSFPEQANPAFLCPAQIRPSRATHSGAEPYGLPSVPRR